MNAGINAGLIIEGLQISIGAGQPLRHCSLRVAPGEVVGLVGESGSGKSLTALACLGLQPPHSRVTGSIRIGDTEVIGSTDKALQAMRGKKLAMIFQNPLSALNPFFTVGRQIHEIVRTHFPAESRLQQQGRIHRALSDVQLGADFAERYPHQLSGGQLQRAMIAMAIACEPDVLIADEPTTALDVTVQARIIRLLKDLTARGMGLLLISHDLDLVAEVADRIVVMYAGRSVESGRKIDVIGSASHPYTVSLLKAQPRMNEMRLRLPIIEGQVLPASARPVGCVFRDRCRRALELCGRELPPTVSLRPESQVECHNPALPALDLLERSGA